MFALCAALGFLPEPEGILRGVLTAVSAACFLPPALLLYRAKREQDTHTLRLVRNLSALSLLLTLLLLVGNFLSALAGERVGQLLYYVLIVVSSPMICSGYWALSLFLWACLLIAAASRR